MMYNFNLGDIISFWSVTWLTSIFFFSFLVI